MSTRTRGFRKDTRVFPSGPIHTLIGGHPVRDLPPPPAEAQLLEPLIRSALGGVQDQQQCSGCVGFTFSDVIGLRMAYLGSPIPLRSGLGIYTIARAEERRDPLNGESVTTPLTDGGSEPGLAVQGLIAYGAPSAEIWPYDPDRINAEPGWTRLEGASACLLPQDGYRAITESGGDFLTACRQMLAQGIPIPAAWDIDQAFEDAGPSTVVTAPDPSNLLGGHAISIIGYRPGQWRILNHWGSSWADGGMVWADDSFVLASMWACGLNFQPGPVSRR